LITHVFIPTFVFIKCTSNVLSADTFYYALTVIVGKAYDD